MIRDAEEFVRLRESTDPAKYRRAATEKASEQTWMDIVKKYPRMREWVAHNDTVPVSVLDLLSKDESDKVRECVAMSRKLTPKIFERLAKDPEATVRMGIVSNAKTPRALLEQLREDPKSWLASRAKSRLAELDR